MNKIKILVVEDSPEEAKFIGETLSGFGYEVSGISDDPEEAYRIFMDRSPHLCIVDIFLKGKPDGVTFARMIGESSRPVPVVFLTGNYDTVTFALAKTAVPHSYLLKPYNPLELQYAIELATDKKNALIKSSDTLFIKSGNYLVRLEVSDIRYIEVEGRYSRITTSREKLLVQQSLKELHRQLPADLFSRIHRNYLVNTSEMVRIDTANSAVLFKDGTTLAISRRYLDIFLDRFRLLT